MQTECKDYTAIRCRLSTALLEQRNPTCGFDGNGYGNLIVLRKAVIRFSFDVR